MLLLVEWLASYSAAFITIVIIIIIITIIIVIIFKTLLYKNLTPKSKEAAAVAVVCV